MQTAQRRGEHWQQVNRQRAVRAPKCGGLPPQHRDQPGVDAAHLRLPERLPLVTGEKILCASLDEVVDDALQQAASRHVL